MGNEIKLVLCVVFCIDVYLRQFAELLLMAETEICRRRVETD